jgi:hypothetical protein
MPIDSNDYDENAFDSSRIHHDSDSSMIDESCRDTENGLNQAMT